MTSSASLRIVLIDGIPASGKSTLARELVSALHDAGHHAVLVENDWFIAPTIRSPLQLLRGALTVFRRGDERGVLESKLVARFLDWSRLCPFIDELREAADAAERGEERWLTPKAAAHNLARRPDVEVPPLRVGPGSVVIIEGTLTRSIYEPFFEEADSVYVEIDPALARTRFGRRNQTEETRRNRAFSSLAIPLWPLHVAREILIGDLERYDIVYRARA